MELPSAAPFQAFMGSAKQSGLLFQQFVVPNPPSVATATIASDQAAQAPADSTVSVSQDVISLDVLGWSLEALDGRSPSLVNGIRSPNPSHRPCPPYSPYSQAAPINVMSRTSPAARTGAPMCRRLPTGAQLRDEQSGLLVDLCEARDRLIPQLSALFSMAKKLESITKKDLVWGAYMEYHSAVQSFLFNMKIFRRCFDFSVSMDIRLGEGCMMIEEQRLLVYRAKAHRELLCPKQEKPALRSVLKGDIPVARRRRTRSAASMPVCEMGALTGQTNNNENRCIECGYNNSSAYEFNRHVRSCGKKRKCRYCNTLLAAYRKDNLKRHLEGNCRSTYNGLFQLLGYWPDPWTVP
ncbi:hypothetical protein BCR43DRAFT_494287 [Syncephalastrum racemosum]|uniref:Uncharacterized protein n=1 Tax=Syncephalastrum racemosum TaxID=13706 RepID=A0A1X2H7W6_SYNRA|nr:hypothetical protein BCR43DRAFT_494287 [Syncephalastrum racemosum]